ncbi:uncharacterized protein LOC117110257 [Anneissia japonica]|uniref:uncharacterized protein LOC117110257 n=1 Tax=Anneissia japonica TaxID=1529436 RepID=UPI0014258C88|nr:uncharacterized protein LOC117110257 [Anneissia japonica]
MVRAHGWEPRYARFFFSRRGNELPGAFEDCSSCCSLLFAEFVRLTGRNAKDEINCRTDTYLLPLSRLPRPRGKFEKQQPQIITEMKEKMLEVDNDDDRKYAAHCLGILSLPFQLNEDIKLLIHLFTVIRIRKFTRLFLKGGKS